MRLNLPGSDELPRWLEAEWLERYLNRGLSDPEIEAFESYALDKPHLIAQIDADTSLKLGLVAASRIRESSGPKSDKVPAQTPRARWLPAAMAASALLALVLGARLDVPAPAGEALAFSSPPRIVFDTTRGEQQLALREPGRADSPVVLIELALPPAAGLMAMNAKVGAETYPLPLPVQAADGFVSLVLPRAWLRELTLEVDYRTGGSTEVRRSEFVVPPEQVP
jgi:hypothetical protein